MEKRILDITVHGLNEAYLRQSQCHALIGAERFAYLLSDPTNNILSVKSWQITPNGRASAQRIEQLCAEDVLLAQPFATTTVGVQNEWHTLVPNRMFDMSRLPAYFALLMQQDGPAMHYGFDDVPFADAQLVYAIESDIKELTDRRFAGARWLHSMTALLESSRALCNGSTYNVFANVYNHHLQVIVFDGQDLLFFNTYRFGSASDFVYYLLLPLKQLQINPAQVSVVLSGEVAEESDVITVMRRFTGPPRFVQRPHMFEYPGAIESLPSHFCHDLYALKLKK